MSFIQLSVSPYIRRKYRSGTILALSNSSTVLTYRRNGETVKCLQVLYVVGWFVWVSLVPVLAQDRRETLVVVTEVGPNSMDIHGVGANRPSYGLSWNVYDRLMTSGKKTLPDGTVMYDYSVLEPELAFPWRPLPA